MSKRFTDGYFALGLVLGAAVAIVLALAVSDYGADCYITDGNSYGDKGQGIQPNTRCWLIPFFIYGEDTLAQWAMALLSLAAVYLLWETLKASRKTLSATQQMAMDAKRVGEAQVAAHMSVTVSEVRLIIDEGRKEAHYRLQFGLRNNGQTTAFNVSAFISVSTTQNRENWTSATPSDVDPGKVGDVDLWQEFKLTGPEIVATDTLVRLNVRYDTVFTQTSKFREPVTARFDFVITRNMNGTHSLMRSDHRRQPKE